MSHLTPAEVRTIEFTERRKGLDREEVEAFMEDVCDTLAADADSIRAMNIALDEVKAQALEAGARMAEAEAEAQAAKAARDEAVAALAAEKEANRTALSEATAALAAAQAGMNEMAAELDSMRATAGVNESVELLASAQHTAAETITKANVFADSVKAEADEYATETRSQADEYATETRTSVEEWAGNARAEGETVIAELNAQAAALREGEADYRARAASVLRSALEFIEVQAVGEAAVPSMEDAGEVDEIFNEGDNSPNDDSPNWG